MKKMSIVCCILLLLSLVTSCADKIEIGNSSEKSDSVFQSTEGDSNGEKMIDYSEQPKDLEEETMKEPNVLIDDSKEETILDSSVWSDNLGEETMKEPNVLIDDSKEETILDSSVWSDNLGEETMEDSNTLTDNLEKDNENINDYTLIVLGQDITKGNYVNFHEKPRYAELPFTAVMKALGANVEQKNENMIEIVFDSKTYVLDTKSVTLVKAGSNNNCIIPAPGSKVYYQIVENELVIDDITFNTIAMMMGIKLKIDVNYQQNIVEINYQ